MKEIKNALNKLADMLSPFDEETAKYALSLKKKSPQDIANDLLLWGGSGSLMDQGIYGQNRDMKRMFEGAAINLGKKLKKAGYTNLRMENWIEAFEIWSKENI